MTEQNSHNPEDNNDIRTQLERSERAAWFRFFISIGFATIAIGLGVQFSSVQFIAEAPKGVLAMSLLAVGFVIAFFAGLHYYPQGFHKRTANTGIVILLIGVVATLISTQFNVAKPHLLPIGIIICSLGFLVTCLSVLRFRK